MKILFICGSLEFGRDGVGDYVRRLAGELTRQGHQTSMLALNDEFAHEEILEIQMDKSVELPALRLPATWKAYIRFTRAQQWVDNFEPDWLSLQFVLFSFHPKGLPYGLGRLLSKLGKNRSWHLMFHELWVGMATNDTLKRKIWGSVQRLIIKSIVEQIQPKLIHTQCTLYFEQLIKAGYNVKKLPLFSNIDIYSNAVKTEHLYEYELSRKGVIKFILFGGLHPQAHFTELLEAVKSYCIPKILDFEFWYVGRNGKELEGHITFLQKANVPYKVFGELPPQDISHLLTVANFGVSTGSPEMLEKNGTIAAMLTHSLPVICVGRKLKFSIIAKIPQMKGTYCLDDITDLLARRPAVDFPNTLAAIAKQYEQDLLLKF